MSNGRTLVVVGPSRSFTDARFRGDFCDFGDSGDVDSVSGVLARVVGNPNRCRTGFLFWADFRDLEGFGGPADIGDLGDLGGGFGGGGGRGG